MSLVDELVADGVLKTPNIIDAFRAIHRRDFVPEELREVAETVNAPLPIGQGQTVSQPWTVAFMLELLQPEPGQRVLDVGAGSGWQTALLAHIVSRHAETVNPQSETRKEGKVFAIERVKELCAFGKANVERYHFLEPGPVQWFCQDATPGLPEHAPFDRIIAAAGLSGRGRDAVPQAWQEQCREGGIIVAPIGSSIWRFRKLAAEDWEEEEYPGFAFVPFVSGEGRGRR